MLIESNVFETFYVYVSYQLHNITGKLSRWKK